MITKILIFCGAALGALYIIGKYPSAALVVMALGLTTIFFLFKDMD